MYHSEPKTAALEIGSTGFQTISQTRRKNKNYKRRNNSNSRLVRFGQLNENSAEPDHQRPLSPPRSLTSTTFPDAHYSCQRRHRPYGKTNERSEYSFQVRLARPSPETSFDQSHQSRSVHLFN